MYVEKHGYRYCVMSHTHMPEIDRVPFGIG